VHYHFSEWQRDSFALGLGIHQEKCSNVVEVKGVKARHLPAAERTKYLLGNEAGDAPI
jgi:hypothetical protein